jgi:hypothetical protein
MVALNERLFEGRAAGLELEGLLVDAGVRFARIGWDYYDNSLELCTGVARGVVSQFEFPPR